MTSKNSFLVNLKKNMRRRIWLIVIDMVLLFFFMPMATVLGLGQWVEFQNPAYISLRRTFTMDCTIGMGSMIQIFMATGLAIFSAMQGYSYMFSKSKLDFYMSNPVNKNVRFWSIYLNGLLIYVASYIINMGIALIIGASQMVDIGAIMPSLLWSTASAFAVFFAVYNITILVVMITGDIKVAVLGTATFLLYPLFLLLMISEFCTLYFKSYYHKSLLNLLKYDFMPLNILVRKHEDIVRVSWDKLQVFIDNPKILIAALAEVLVVGIVFLAIAKLAYDKKPSESCGKSIAFKNLQGIIKVALTVLVGGVLGTFFRNVTSSDSNVYMILGLVIGVLLGHAICEIIIHAELKAALRGVKSLCVSAVVVAVMFCVFNFDLIGYDRYVPSADKVSSTGFYMNGYWWCNFYDKNGDWIDYETKIEEDMHLTCFDEAIKPLALSSMPGFNGISESGVNDADNNYYEYGMLVYHMTDGSTKYRVIYFDINKDAAYLDKIMADPAYYECLSTLNQEEFVSKLDSAYMTVSLNCGLNSIEMKEIDKVKLFEIYKAEADKLSFTDMRDETILGQLEAAYSDNLTYMNNNYPIYANFKNTIAFLEENGYTVDYSIEADMIDKIHVTNYHNELSVDTEFMPGEDMPNFTVETEITDPTQIAEIVEHVYPSMINNYWKPNNIFDENFYLEIYLKNNAGSTNAKRVYMENYGYDDGFMYQNSYSYQFFKDQAPQFVIDATAYTGM